MSKHIDFRIYDDASKVQIKMTERDVYGRIRSHRTRQFTVSRVEFEAALAAASIEMPWKAVTGDE
jgi:hypothetical protein